MSNPLKSIGKTFKSVVKIAKKVALPALAIGAVVLTGGAALGILPAALGGAAGVGGLLANLGISGPLAGILSSAASSATIGAIGSALTGGSIVKGATGGFLMGGALGGIGALTGAGAAAAGQAGNAATGTAGGNATTAATRGLATPGGIAKATSGMTVPTAVGGAAQSAGQVAGPAALTSTIPGQAPVPSSSGIFASLGLNDPLTRAMAIQGLGAGLSSQADARERQRDRDRITDNYSGAAVTSLPTMAGLGAGNALPGAGATYNSRIYGNSRLVYDPQSGQVRQVGG